MEALSYEKVREDLAPLDGYRRSMLHASTAPVFRREGQQIFVDVRDPDHLEADPSTFVVTRELWKAIAEDLGSGERYFMNTPPAQLLPQVNWWYGSREANKAEVFMLSKPGLNENQLGLELVKANRHPITPTRMLEVLHGVVRDRGGEPTYTFYERQGLREVTIACVQPDRQYEVEGSRQVGDIVRGGVLVQFSPVGTIAPRVSDYVDRLICTNGMTSTDTLDVWSMPGGDGANDAYEWLPSAVGSAFDGIDARFEEIQRMANTEVPEDAVETVVTDLFDHYRTPAGLRAAVLRRLANQNVETLWDLQNAITWAATHDEHIRNSRQRVRLMSLGGDFPAHSTRCESCNHLVNGVRN